VPKTLAQYHNKILIRNDLDKHPIEPRRSPVITSPDVRVLIDYRPALRTRSGAGEYVHELARALLAAHGPQSAANGLDLTLFSSSWKDRLDRHDPELAGADTVDCRVPVRALNFAWHRLGWPPAETLTRQRFDVTHSMHPLLLPARGAAQVVTIHDLNFLAHPEWTRGEIRRDYPALVRAHAHRADHIIVPSQFTAAEVERRLEVTPARVSLCPPGAPAWRPLEHPPSDGGYVLFFGTLEPRKNLGALLDAYERLLARHYTPPPLVVAGSATDAAREWIERMDRPPLDRVVRHIGYVRPNDRRQLYEGARVLVQPSFEEGFGMPVLEAMTLGVPVVAANRGSLPEVLGGAGVLVEPDDPDALASALERMIEDAAHAAECAAKGVRQAATFRWDATARRVYGVYRQAIERRRCGSA
jgi:glycosyltransferase involved in cell wall biosynthesis